MSAYLDVEGAHRAAARLEAAADRAQRAADNIESAIHKLTLMVEPGYGNNVCRLIELLEKQEESPS